MAEHRRARKKVKKRMRRGCFTSLLSAALLMIGAIILFVTPIFDVNSVTVEGNTRVAKEVILSVSGIKIGDNIFSISSSKAKKKITSLQYVEDVKIVKQFPDKVKIKITEGKISAYILSGEKVVGVNSEGKVLCVINTPGIRGGAPVVKGFTVTESQMGKIVAVNERKKFDTFSKFMKTFNDKGMLEKLTEFDITDDDYIVFWYEDKLKIEFGDIQHFENKFDYLSAILDYQINSTGNGEEITAQIPEGVINMISENYTFRSVALKKTE